MCLRTLHDRVRDLGMGAMYEAHLHCGFRDLLDSNSAEWASSDVALKVIHLKAFDAAGVPLAEIIEHYREARAPPHAGQPAGHGETLSGGGLLAPGPGGHRCRDRRPSLTRW